MPKQQGGDNRLRSTGRKKHSWVFKVLWYEILFLCHTLINVRRYLACATPGHQNNLREQTMGIKIKLSLRSAQTRSSLLFTNNSRYTSRHTASRRKELRLKATTFFFFSSNTQRYVRLSTTKTARRLHLALKFHAQGETSVNISCIPWHTHWQPRKRRAPSPNTCARTLSLAKGKSDIT